MSAAFGVSSVSTNDPMSPGLCVLTLRLCLTGIMLAGLHDLRAAVVVTQIQPPTSLVEGRPNVVIDFNHDGIEELRFVGSLTQPGGFIQSHVQIQGIAATPPNLGSMATPVELMELVGAVPSSVGAWISPTLDSFTLRVYFDNGIQGYWPTGTYLGDPLEVGGPIPILPESGYLAVLFSLPDGDHYGWVEVGVLGFGAVGYVRSYGWETEPGVPIVAGVPEPGRLLLFLAGAFAWGCRRRRKMVGQSTRHQPRLIQSPKRQKHLAARSTARRFE